MNDENITLLFATIIFITFIYLFFRLANRIRKHGGSMLTTMYASTYEFLDSDKREAVEQVLEMKAGKKMEEELSCEPKDKVK